MVTGKMGFPDPHDWDKELNTDALIKFFAPPLGVTVLVSFIFGVLYLALLRIIPAVVLYSTIAIMVVAPAVLGVIAYNYVDLRQLDTNQVMMAGGGLAGVTLVELLFFYFARSKVELSCKLLGVAAVGLDRNISLLFFVPALNILLLMVIIPLAGLMAVTYTNGELMPNPLVMDGKCGFNTGHACCQWRYDRWVPYYLGWSAFSILWTVMLAFEIRVFTVGGTIAQWYFADYGSSHASLCTSFGHALGPSLGTLCLASFILALLQTVKEIIDRLKRDPEKRGSYLTEMVACCLECMFQIIEFISKFATITASITGEGFWQATKSASWLLKQSLLSATIVDRLSVVVLNAAALVLALLWGVALGFFCYFNWRQNPVPGFTEEEAMPLAVVEGGLAFCIIFIVLRFFATVMINVVDAVYICYAIDKYGGMLTMPEIHEVYSQVPLVKGSRIRSQEGWSIDEQEYEYLSNYQPQPQ
ncbi:hypothetical protein CBR_g32587 [Chara braunii]|uniref:Choline transporter-like protein n=1 Tax=Chara braunii TaxID=69332 RepID=A0A388LH71_CHABU|nr:hypothetical protein CBR_g32587 [Chara braunii]|eukprot:GBG81595.1 hypothetical protein CBR_g32587 [Chara braunii]